MMILMALDLWTWTPPGTGKYQKRRRNVDKEIDYAFIAGGKAIPHGTAPIKETPARPKVESLSINYEQYKKFNPAIKSIPRRPSQRYPTGSISILLQRHSLANTSSLLQEFLINQPLSYWIQEQQGTLWIQIFKRKSES